MLLYMYAVVPLVFVGLTLGIIAESVSAFGWALASMCAALAGALVVLARTRRGASTLYIVGAIVMCAVAVGVVRVHIAPPLYGEILLEQRVSFSGVVVAESDVRDGYTNLIVKSDAFAGKVLVRTSSAQEFHWYDSIEVEGVARTPEAFTTDTGREFNYRAYLGKDEIYTIVTAESVKVRLNAPSVRDAIVEMKRHYVEILSALLPEPDASLAAGITVGERRGLGETLTSEFRHAGLIHIVVLSGYNIAIILVAVMAVCAFLPRGARALVALISILFFVLLVGPSATVVRAALMGGIAACGVMLQRTYSALSALFVAALCMVLYNPHIVLHDPSFQLSFIATLGLLVGAPLILTTLAWVPERFGMRELVAVTVATQIAVVPLLVFLMGEVSLVALGVNMLALPVIPLAMATSACAGVVGMASALVAAPCAYATHYLLGYVLFIVHTWVQLPFAVVEVPSISVGVLIGMYVALGIGVWLWYIRAR